jgi:hypothetical protein
LAASYSWLLDWTDARYAISFSPPSICLMMDLTGFIAAQRYDLLDGKS